jgi:transposase
MMLLWEEYRETNQDAYGYSRFCDLLRGFERRLSPVMRQHYVAGDKAIVDYSGKRISIVDPATGELHVPRDNQGENSAAIWVRTRARSCGSRNGSLSGLGMSPGGIRGSGR